MAGSKEDRLFTKDGRRHYRRRYSLTEVRIGAVVLLLLGAILGWVVYKGAHPDPELYAAPPGLKDRTPTAAVDRGQLPEGLAPSGWIEKSLSTFGPDNLYEKINGREGFYKALGFEQLFFVSIENEKDGADAVAVEAYDLGRAENALGAFSGEVAPGTSIDVAGDGLAALDRNALYLTRARIYIRAIGSDESEPIRDVLRHVRKVFEEKLPGEALPWSHALFLGLGIGPGKVSYVAENAFSFGFAGDFHIGLLDDDETELFVSARADPSDAQTLSKQLAAGFLEYGSAEGSSAGVTWVADRYLSRVSGATASGRFVIGVRGAENAKTAAAWLAKLKAAVDALPEGAAKAAPPPTGGGGVEEY